MCFINCMFNTAKLVNFYQTTKDILGFKGVVDFKISVFFQSSIKICNFVNTNILKLTH